MSEKSGPIGIFDSGYGGLTVLKEIAARMPEYDYLYLGDNARAPYGTRSFETVYEYSLQCVQKLFELGCHLVVVACNTASAKALRTIQQNDLPDSYPGRRVLGVIRPTTEIVGHFSKSGEIGILGTAGTVQSDSYRVEVQKFFPGVKVYQEACPMWVPLIENNDFANEGGEFFIRRHIQRLLAKSAAIDAVILACTHYPLILTNIRKYIPDTVRIISQGPIVAAALEDYLQRHPELKSKCSLGGKITFLTTDEPAGFDRAAGSFYPAPVRSSHVTIGK